MPYPYRLILCWKLASSLRLILHWKRLTIGFRVRVAYYVEAVRLLELSPPNRLTGS